MILIRSSFIGTFSRRKNLGFASFRILTNSKNNFERESSKFSPLPALENHWQGLPPMSRSIFPSHTTQSHIKPPHNFFLITPQ
nr:MAG TPA: Site specific DNA methylase [Caudoviricetes sp.]